MEIISSINISLLLSVIALFFISVTINLWKYLRKRKLRYIKESPELILIYLDKYYINNIIVVIIYLFIYLAINFSLIIFLRSRYFYDCLLTDNIKLELFSTSNILYLFCNIFLILTGLTFFKLSLDKLFFDEFIKLHLFLNKNDYYIRLRSLAKESHYIAFFGKLYLFFYNICKLRTLRDLSSNIDYWDFYLYETIYENDNIRLLSDKCVAFSLKSRIILFLMQLLKIIFKTLFYHIRLHNGIVTHIPGILFICAIFYTYFQDKPFNIIYFFLIYFLMKTTINSFIFITSKHPIIDTIIADYFYGKHSNYSSTRIYLKDDIKHYFEMLKKFKENESLILRINNLNMFPYLMNDFDYITHLNNKEDSNSLKALYRKIVIIIFFLLCTIMIYTKNKVYIVLKIYNMEISLMYLWIPMLCLLIYVTKHTYKIIRENNDESYNNAIYNSNKVMIGLFWILTLFLICFLFGIYIGNTVKNIDIIFTSSRIDIIKHYTIAEKVIIFYEYFQKYIKKCNIEGQHLANLNLFINELNIETMIFNDTTIEEITKLIEDLLLWYFSQVEKVYYIKTPTQNFMDILITFANTLILWKFFARYVEAYNLILNPMSLKMAKLIHTFVKIFNQFKG